MTLKFDRKFKGASGSEGKHIVGDKYSDSDKNVYIGKNESIVTAEKHFVQVESKNNFKPIQQNWFKTEQEARQFAHKKYWK